MRLSCKHAIIQHILFLAREHFGRLVRIKFYDNQTGEDTIHLVEETPISFYTTFIVPKSSPFISAYNAVISQAHESGLINYLIKAAFYQAELKRIQRYRKGLIKNKKIQVIRAQQLTDLLYFFLICIIFCFIVFTLEILNYKCKLFSKKKHENLKTGQIEIQFPFKL